MDIDLKELIIRGADLLDEGKFDFDRKAFLNASEAGSCIRKQWYGHHEAEFEEPQDWGYARRGSHGEKFVVDALKASNVPLIHAWPEQWSLQDKERRISGTPDGYIAYDDEWLGLEIKTIDPRTNMGNLPKPEHVAQIQICMELIDQQIDRPKGAKFDRGLLMYMDASNFYQITQYEIPRDAGILDRMVKRARKVLDADTPDSLDREGKTKGGKECRTMCGFREVCGVKLEDGRAGKRANRGSKFDGHAKRYADIKDEEDRLKMERDSLKEDIIDDLRDREMTKVMVGNISVELATVKGRASLDRKAVKSAGIDLSPFEKVGASSERLTIKRS